MSTHLQTHEMILPRKTVVKQEQQSFDILELSQGLFLSRSTLNSSNQGKPNQEKKQLRKQPQKNHANYHSNTHAIRQKCQLRAGDWICNQCSNHNYSFREECNSCHKQTKTENLLQLLKIQQGIALEQRFSSVKNKISHQNASSSYLRKQKKLNPNNYFVPQIDGSQLDSAFSQELPRKQNLECKAFINCDIKNDSISEDSSETLPSQTRYHTRDSSFDFDIKMLDFQANDTDSDFHLGSLSILNGRQSAEYME